jgi:signal transduction histidine kinase
MTIKLRILVCVLLLELAGYGLVLLLSYNASREGLTAVREEQIAATFLGYLHKINALTGSMERNAVDLARAGESYHALRERVPAAQLLPDMERHLVRNFEHFPEAIGGGWWYEPHAFDAARKHVGPYAFRDAGRVRFTWDLSTPQYDYPNQGWYTHALPRDWPRDAKPKRSVVWTEPYYDEAGSMALMMTVDALMFDRDERVIGMATVDWSTEGMRRFVSAIKVTPGSFSFLIDRQSTRFVSFVAANELVMRPAISQAWAPPVLEQAQTGTLRHVRSVDWKGRPHRVYFIGTDVGLILGLFIPEDEILLELMPGLRRSVLLGALVSVTFIVAMALVLTVLFRPFQRVLAQIGDSLRREDGKLALKPLRYGARNEFTPIVAALNEVFAQISEFTASLAAANSELETTHREINELNASLERKVARRTDELAAKNEALSRTLADLADAQKQLAEAEKHAALNQLVAGVAHEVGTPLGVAITGASHLLDELTQVRRRAESHASRDGELELHLASAIQTVGITQNNLQRAASMVRSFKQIAVDQGSEARRRFNVHEYVSDVLLSLRPRLKRCSQAVELDCPPDLDVDGYPGALSQVVTNLVINAQVHAYPNDESGTIRIAAKRNGVRWSLTFSDDGKGIAPEHLPQIFEPFFTTRRGHGGSGLGLHIVHNLVTQTMRGRIHCTSRLGEGTAFVIDLPLEVV